MILLICFFIFSERFLGSCYFFVSFLDLFFRNYSLDSRSVILGLGESLSLVEILEFVGVVRLWDIFKWKFNDRFIID